MISQLRPRTTMKHTLPSTLVTTVQHGGDPDLPNGDTTLVLDRVERAFATYPLRPALRFHGKTQTYRDLEQRVQERAGVLRRMGLSPGVTLGLLLPDCPAIVSYTLAAFSVGATVVLLDPASADVDLADRVAALGISHLVTCDLASVHAKVEPLLQHGIEQVVVVAYVTMLPITAAARLRLLQSHKLARIPAAHPQTMFERDLLADQRNETVARAGETPRRAAADDIAFRSRPSPNGPTALSTQRGLATNVGQLLEALPHMEGGSERLLAALPLSNPLSLTLAALVGLVRGAEIVIAADFAPSSLATGLRDAAPTIMIATPPILDALLAHPGGGGTGFGQLRYGVTVGAPAPVRLHQALAAVTRAPLLQSWAVAAASSFVALARPDDAAIPLGGHCLALSRVVVRDLADPSREVPRGERGELCVAGPQIAPGVASGNGYLPTGDLGLVDVDGRIVLVDRVEDLIVAAGYLIYPCRIEAALLEHPGIEAAAVIGVDDGRRGTAPKAFVVARRGQAITERDLRLHLESRISRIEMPADIDFCTRLPRTSSGFVCKPTLRRQEAARQRR
jgi:long-chain acyl-CoA synthetase